MAIVAVTVHIDKGLSDVVKGMRQEVAISARMYFALCRRGSPSENNVLGYIVLPHIPKMGR